jgi:rhamnogalacturonyl hydrolase YesR
MLRASEITGDPRFAQYTRDRLAFIAKVANHYRPLVAANASLRTPVRAVLQPRSLDDIGSMAASMIKAERAGGVGADLRSMINTGADYVATKEFRLSDGTLARNRPLADSLWLDDMYMGIPVLAHMGALTGERRYFDDATKQVKQFSQRMFNPQTGLYMHGWIQGMEDHPEFRWGRANGWAALSMSDLLDVLPENHPDRPFVLNQLRAHLKGLLNYQSGSGFWHQLLDRNDSYEETSATAIFTYVIAHAANKGWIDAKAYGPAAILGWHALSTKINDKGQVEDVVVGTGMGFDPAYYYHRQKSVMAAHGYGPAILAAAEIIELSRKTKFVINDSAVMYGPPVPTAMTGQGPTFSGQRPAAR